MSEEWTLHKDRRRASSFGDDPEAYDRVRPPYPAALIDVLVAEQPHAVARRGVRHGDRRRACCSPGVVTVLGLEPDPRMADVARRRGVEVEAGTIEEWEAGDRRFDLLTAGQAWHWVDPVQGGGEGGTGAAPRWAHRAVLEPGFTTTPTSAPPSTPPTPAGPLNWRGRRCSSGNDRHRSTNPWPRRSATPAPSVRSRCRPSTTKSSIRAGNGSISPVRTATITRFLRRNWTRCWPTS